MNQRLRELLNALKEEGKIHSDANFARKIGIDKGDLSRMMSGTKSINQRFVGRVTEAFPYINDAWLISGEGEMLKNCSANSNDHSVSIAGKEIRENKINVNADETIASLIAEVAAQRKLTEIALKQNSDLIALLGQRK